MQRPIYKCALVLLCLLAVSPQALAQTTDGDALYQRSLARLHALPQQPYIEYTMSQSNGSPDDSARSTLVEIVIERRADRTSWNAVEGGNSLPVNGVLIGRHFLIPDMFLRAGPIGPTVEEGAGALPQLDDVATPPPNAEPLKTIATVGTRPSHRYNIAVGDQQNIPNCGTVTHLILRPTGDPEFDNVRELWIRTSDAVMCKVRYTSKLFEVRHTSIANSLDVTATLNEDGLVTSWTSSGHVYMPVPGYSTVGDGTFTSYLWKDAEPEYLFDEKLWVAHANAVRASLKASPSPGPR
jgi:hypothetical protein